MNDKIRAHIDSLLQGVPPNRRVQEIREELLSNCNDKYNDLLAKGVAEDEAYRTVIEGIGDINALLSDVVHAQNFSSVEIRQAKARQAAFVAIGVALYIVAIISVIVVGGMFDQDELAIVAMFAIAAVATGLIIYGNMTTHVDYVRQDDTVVEEIKEQMAGSDRRSKLSRALSSTLWSFIVIVYLLTSFLTMAWHITWIIFLVGAALQNVIQLFLASPEHRRKHWVGLLWVVTVIVYFIFSFTTNYWHVSWMIFPIAVAVQQAIRLYMIWRETA